MVTNLWCSQTDGRTTKILNTPYVCVCAKVTKIIISDVGCQWQSQKLPVNREFPASEPFPLYHHWAKALSVIHSRCYNNWRHVTVRERSQRWRLTCAISLHAWTRRKGVTKKRCWHKCYHDSLGRAASLTHYRAIQHASSGKYQQTQCQLVIGVSSEFLKIWLTNQFITENTFYYEFVSRVVLTSQLSVSIHHNFII